MSRRLGLLVLVTSVVVTAGYALVYLSRWEWQRAIVALLLLLVAEVALVGGLVLARTAPSRSGFGDRVAERLEAVPDPPAGTFRWLAPVGRGESTAVFLPILLGVGVLASGLGWIAETVARRATRGYDVRTASSALGALDPPDRLVPLTAADLLRLPGSWEGLR